MYQWLKDHFVPHEGNDGRPHFLRKEMTVIIVVLVLLLEALYLLQSLVVIPNSRFLSEVISAVLIEETNQRRLSGDLSGLKFNPLLESAAQLKAEDMAARGYFAHNTPDGKTPWYFLDQVGYTYQTAGENLAVNFTESSDVTDAWMRSPGHRANILNGNYSEIGIATAKGVYKGNEAIFVVQFFGKPKLAVLSSPENNISENSSSLATTTASSSLSLVLGSQAASSTMPVVLGEESEEPLEEIIVPTKTEVPMLTQESTTSMPQVETPVSTPSIEREQVLSAENKPNLWVRIALSPRTIMSYALIIIGSAVFLALVLVLVVRVRRQHTHLIGNAILVLALITLLYLINLLLSGAFLMVI